MDRDERAYELLKFQSLAPLGGFDPSFPYFDVWKAGSDAALDQWDKNSPYESSPELTAFRELERMGHYTQKDFYSPSKAKDGFYTEQLQTLRGDRERRDGDCPPESSPKSSRGELPNPRPNGQSKGKSERPRLRRRGTR